MEKLALDFIYKMVDDFGVCSCLDNLDEDNDLESEGLWYECPICGEPILLDDWKLEEVIERCPVCECDYYEE